MTDRGKGWLIMAGASLLLWSAIFWAWDAFAQMPPRQYRGDARLTVQFTTARNVESLCNMISEGRLRRIEACANEQVMILPDPCGYPGRYAEIVCHEIGHARGWVHQERVG